MTDTKCHPLEIAAERLGAPSTHWLMLQLRARKLPGRKVGRSWCMTDSDINEAIELLASPALVRIADPAPVVGGHATQPGGVDFASALTAGSRRRMASRSA
ncbi:hypothetical protein [Nocardia tengchongensis]|uniref:hypothetical protein n=1 Tax=Nocardia tengchongensis TaxID=2055889 RepID=UPI003607D5DE